VTFLHLCSNAIISLRFSACPKHAQSFFEDATHYPPCRLAQNAGRIGERDLFAFSSKQIYINLSIPSFPFRSLLLAFDLLDIQFPDNGFLDCGKGMEWNGKKKRLIDRLKNRYSNGIFLMPYSLCDENTGSVME